MEYFVGYILIGTVLLFIRIAEEKYLRGIGYLNYSKDHVICDVWGRKVFVILLWPLVSSKVFKYQGIIRSLRRERVSCSALLIRVKDLKLQGYDQISILYKDGSCSNGAYKYLDEDLMELRWYRSGTQMSGGGWDMTSCVTSIEDVIRLQPGDKGYNPSPMW